ncbi:hypothetical protein M406DRAFT_356736 [Cryphonectria parasitica EP155]|uniref:BHLH domain-containing protein n=1 Tax=Cryphonectria parasitica (strain ATCC 38755 / EP155) TaxID=660469 RepID=A0A9P5CN01_CRYP1|nr:uncharacterized protein M406DRAFT_356736 [Cryphonectria parasitica EP155]KAF3764929.1 hypothetical protein M406DRAFT_356736 [Cryphonectria parasitica EP155]
MAEDTASRLLASKSNYQNILEGNLDSGAESGDKKEAKNGSTPSSKASTVEMAIEYIKQLKQEIADATKRAEEAEKKLQEKEASSAFAPAPSSSSSSSSSSS